MGMKSGRSSVHIHSAAFQGSEMSLELKRLYIQQYYTQETGLRTCCNLAKPFLESFLGDQGGRDALKTILA